MGDGIKTVVSVGGTSSRRGESCDGGGDTEVHVKTRGSGESGSPPLSRVPNNRGPLKQDTTESPDGCGTLPGNDLRRGNVGALRRREQTTTEIEEKE